MFAILPLLKSRRGTVFGLVCIAGLLFCPGVCAQGALEINQVCAQNGGCFPGDSAGFPVEITTPGSYVLTGNLDLSAIPDTTAVSITSDMVTLDLGGFVITGDATCTGTGQSLSCSTGNGNGIVASAPVVGLTIRNGVVRNMSRFGIAAGVPSMRIENISVRNNGNTGLNVGESALVINTIANENQVFGISVGDESVISNCTSRGNGNTGVNLGQNSSVTGCTSFGNGASGFELGLRSTFGLNNRSSFNVDPDDCGGGVCSTNRRFYVTEAEVAGDEALTQCSAGFRMANFYELFDPTQLQYDVVLGEPPVGEPDGTPQAQREGWVRNGSVFDSQNCNQWTNGTDMVQGFTAELRSSDAALPATVASPWTTVLANCDSELPVWCIEEE